MTTGLTPTPGLSVVECSKNSGQVLQNLLDARSKECTKVNSKLMSQELSQKVKFNVFSMLVIAASL